MSYICHVQVGRALTSKNRNCLTKRKLGGPTNLLLDVCFRNFLKSKWGMEEFIIADHEAVNGRKNFIIIILKEKLEMKGLWKEVKLYLETHTYIDGTKRDTEIPDRLRWIFFWLPQWNWLHQTMSCSQINPLSVLPSEPHYIFPGSQCPTLLFGT